jgi:hypothetical protein
VNDSFYFSLEKWVNSFFLLGLAGKVTNKLTTKISVKMSGRSEAESANQSFALKSKFGFYEKTLVLWFLTISWSESVNFVFRGIAKVA